LKLIDEYEYEYVFILEIYAKISYDIIDDRFSESLLVLSSITVMDIFDRTFFRAAFKGRRKELFQGIFRYNLLLYILSRLS
jgi:hypothetical protein